MSDFQLILDFQRVVNLNLNYGFSYDQKDYTLPVRISVGYDLSRDEKYVERCRVETRIDYRGMDLKVQEKSPEIGACMHAWLIAVVIKYFESKEIDPQKIRQYLDQYRIGQTII
ncbi:MAG: hypothetical protein J4428_03010 [Candidatus Aenigmarchaeota archaeon]|nr:hypothetical protein [Candidatus Aenigmarchaeota archaeon]